MSAEARFAAKVCKPAAIAEHYKDFAGEEYDECIQKTYGYEAHLKIPEQILARTAVSRLASATCQHAPSCSSIRSLPMLAFVCRVASSEFWILDAALGSSLGHSLTLLLPMR